MMEAIGSLDLVLAAAVFATAALITLSLALLWEAVRRWLRERAASQALRRIGEREHEGQDASSVPRERLVVEDRPLGPAWLEPLLLRVPRREDLQRLLDQSGLRWSVGSLILACLGSGLGVGFASAILLGSPFAAVLLAAVGAYLPLAWVKLKRSRRFGAFEEHFPDAIDLLARAARAGHSLAAGIQVVGDEAEEPVAGEFRQIYQEQRFGLPFSESLLSLADRVDLVDVRIFVTAVLIQRESGGNLAENLDGLSSVIRSRFRFKRDVKTKSAHGRMTALVVGLAPFVAGIGMYAINPDYMTPLLVEPLGRVVLAVGAVMMVTGFFVVRRMADLQV